jgi:sec-independent protein translocase protein TatC
VPLFLVGCAAGWYVVPHIVVLMSSFVPTEDESIIEAKGYFDFILKLILVTGVAFVLPVFPVLLNFLGILQGMTITRSWRVAILAITLFTVIATPAADVRSMFLLAAPTVRLSLDSCGVTILHDRRVSNRLDADLTGSPPEKVLVA